MSEPDEDEEYELLSDSEDDSDTDTSDEEDTLSGSDDDELWWRQLRKAFKFIKFPFKSLSIKIDFYLIYTYFVPVRVSLLPYFHPKDFVRRFWAAHPSFSDRVPPTPSPPPFPDPRVSQSMRFFIETFWYEDIIWGFPLPSFILSQFLIEVFTDYNDNGTFPISRNTPIVVVFFWTPSNEVLSYEKLC